MEKTNGPRMEPWGTPTRDGVTGEMSECQF